MPGILTNEPIIPRNVAALLNNPVNWEWITGDEAPDEDAFAATEASAMMQGYLKNHKLLKETVATFVGFSYVKDQLLKRRLPMQHPRWPWLRCKSLTIKGVKFNGTEEAIVGGGGAALQHNPKYERYRFLINYEGLGYDCRSDQATIEDGTGEWGRFLTIEPKPSGEILTQEGGDYRYNAPDQTWNGHPAIGPHLRVRLERTDFLITAHGIAHDFILNDFGVPTNLASATAKVNSVPFLGCPAGTMLLKEVYPIEKKPQPIATANLDRLSFGCTVKMLFGYFNPRRKFPIETNAGWQLVPPPGGAGMSGPTGGWVYIYAPPAMGGGGLYGTYDMHRCLQYRDDELSES